MTMQNGREQGEDLARMMESADVITDPARGNFLDVLM
jgi:hypothetical protein